jgi:wyosine [tRNA(Phe)-imidazoG37] synthetase (radical SAM superfamily)
MTSELNHLIQSVLNGELFEHGMFKEVPPELRRLNDIAFSGDGEPTSESCFLQACQSVSQIKKTHHLDHVKIVLISNSTMFHKPTVQEGLDLIMNNNGEIWAKLDAGTEAYYREIDKTQVPFQRVLDNILKVSKQYPIIIQTLFTIMDQEVIPQSEVEAYAKHLRSILEQGGQIKEVHLHTLARPPAYPRVESLTKTQLDQIATTIQNIVDLPITTFAGRAG